MVLKFPFIEFLYIKESMSHLRFDICENCRVVWGEEITYSLDMPLRYARTFSGVWNHKEF